MSVFYLNNENKNLAVELKENNKENNVNNKKGDNMARFDENKVNVVDVEETNNKDKIIGYNTYYYCSKCGTEVKEDHKYCSECGEKLIEEKKGDNMVKVLNLTTEQFEELIDEEVFFIETEMVEINPDFQARYTKEELLEELNNLIGILNIKEAKEFVFKYGDRKSEDEDIYNTLLLREIIESDEVLDREVTIIMYYYSDSIGTDLGSWDYSVSVGYDLKY